MKINCCILLFSLAATCCYAQFDPPAGQPGSRAIYKDSSAITAWATGCTITRGYQDISNPALGYASTGDSSMALGIAGTGGVVSLGDGGIAVLTFANPIQNGPGPDFAVFENGFSDTFLELAFVEVSSDGINFYRFPATSYTQDTVQVAGFDPTDATKINNLAGKYRALYGTPFDLEELTGLPGLDVDAITHVKIIDVVGCIQNAYATYDQYGNKINDPWSTPFASSGFDLDAVGVLNEAIAGVAGQSPAAIPLQAFPNPVNTANATVQYSLNETAHVDFTVLDLSGKTVLAFTGQKQEAGAHTQTFGASSLPNGVYFVRLQTEHATGTVRIVVSHE